MDDGLIHIQVRCVYTDMSSTVVDHVTFVLHKGTQVMCVRHKRCKWRWNVENKVKTGSAVLTWEESRSPIPVSPSSINRVSSVHLLLPSTSSQICFKQMPFHPLPHKPFFKRHLLKANSERDTREIACTESSAGGRLKANCERDTREIACTVSSAGERTITNLASGSLHIRNALPVFPLFSTFHLHVHLL
jgi:hypothetical protein